MYCLASPMTEEVLRDDGRLATTLQELLHMSKEQCQEIMDRIERCSVGKEVTEEII
jgi:hypothetical protein